MTDNDTVVETDQHYSNEIKLKQQLLEEDHHYYFNSLQETEAAQWEAVEKILTDLVKHDHINFKINKDNSHWTFINKKLTQEFTFTFGDSSSLPQAPLDWIGRQIQEDLIILNAAGEVVAGQLCFPSGWALNEKLGKQFMEVHAPLPSVTNPMIQAANKLIERLPLNKPVSRNNWGFRLGDQLDLSSKHSTIYREKLNKQLPQLTNTAFGESIFLRVEHQTLTRLPQSGFVMFTIHTYNSSLREEASNSERSKMMLSFLKTTPPELIDYKVMTLMYPQLIDYLECVTLKNQVD